MNTSKQSFKGIQVGDRIRFRLRDGTFRLATVNPLLIFDTHVVVNHGTCGTVVDEGNYIGHKTPKARVVNLPQKPAPRRQTMGEEWDEDRGVGSF